MLQVSATVSRDSLQKTMNALAAMGKAVGLTTQFVCYDSMRLWCINCMKRTAPWANGKPGNTSKQKKSGDAAIIFDLMGGKKDHRGIIGWITPEMTSYMDWNDELPNHTLIKLKGGGVYLVDRNLYNESAGEAELRAHHLKFRGKNGRVTSAGSGDRRIGRWKVVDKMFAKKAVVKAYLKKQRAEVGLLKAGWLPAITHYAQLSRGSKGKVPQWIARHAGVGGAGGNMDERGNGSLYAENTSHHSDAIREDGVRFAQKVTEKGLKVGKNGIPYRLEQLIKQWDSGRIPKPELRSAA